MPMDSPTCFRFSMVDIEKVRFLEERSEENGPRPKDYVCIDIDTELNFENVKVEKRKTIAKKRKSPKKINRLNHVNGKVHCSGIRKRNGVGMRSCSLNQVNNSCSYFNVNVLSGSNINYNCESGVTGLLIALAVVLPLVTLFMPKLLLFMFGIVISILFIVACSVTIPLLFAINLFLFLSITIVGIMFLPFPIIADAFR